ncbi:MAG: PIG-L family deacetylase [Flavobacteriales bacterium]|nr:PIG-L family deacetylase [Flavobacteriales bacterium]
MHFFNVRALAVALALSAFLLPLSTFPQRPPAQPNAAEILHKMQKLQVLGSVLYIAAHPDDENTRLIAWLSNGKKVRTGYLSLTRGDGGQNLIGPELGDALGIIRTQELLEARRIDGGEQFFTRAVDFGYSKSAEESFEKWGKQEVLRDVVRVIRMFQPDIIITRFPTDGSGGHGHHTASAILANEAFDLAGDPKAFPEQLQQGLEVWQPRRLFFNGSSWWRKDVAELAQTDPDWFSVDVGGYDPLLGLSYTEIAGRSRSMHKSQGFGAAETRGEMLEYLHLEKGDRPKTKDIFEGIDMTWGRIPNGTRFQDRFAKIIHGYDLQSPAASIDALQSLRTEMGYDTKALNNSELRMSSILQRDIGNIVVFALGLSVELSYTSPFVTDINAPSECVLTNRSSRAIQSWLFPGDTIQPFLTRKCSNCTQDFGIQSGPFWLERAHAVLYDVPSAEIGQPVIVEYASTYVSPTSKGDNIRLDLAAQYKWVDRVDGERIRPVYITPVASIIPKTNILIARGGTQTIEVEVEALTDDLYGQLTAIAPKGWKFSDHSRALDVAIPGSAPVSMGSVPLPENRSAVDVYVARRNERESFTFRLTPSTNAEAGVITFAFSGPKGKADRTLHEIDYPHIMPQVYYTPAEVKLIPLDVKVNAQRVGYIKGAGDDVPQAIERLGVAVEMVDPSTATLESIAKYDAIVVGIRAYNTEKAMAAFNPTLMRYVESGGTVVAQYNTRSSDMVLPDSLFGPYPFKLTRDRVTVEEAPPTFLDPKHPLLNSPNTITVADFDGWVQERGLYFCGSLDPHYTPLIAWNDPGEEPLNGGLITCDYGKGRYVYTGISFFRELPAGVPGAYRLFANLISNRSVRTP